MRQWSVFVGGLGVLILVLSSFTSNEVDAVGLGLILFSITLALSSLNRDHRAAEETS